MSVSSQKYFHILKSIFLQTRGHFSRIPLLSFKGSFTSVPLDKAEFFASNFQSKMKLTRGGDYKTLPSSPVSLSAIDIEVVSIRKLLRKLNSFKAGRPSQISPCVVRELADVLGVQKTVLI